MWKIVITANVEIENEKALKMHARHKTNTAYLDMEIENNLKQFNVYLNKDYIGKIINEGEQIAYWQIGAEEAYCQPIYAKNGGLAIEVMLIMKPAELVTAVQKKRQ